MNSSYENVFPVAIVGDSHAVRLVEEMEFQWNKQRISPPVELVCCGKGGFTLQGRRSEDGRLYRTEMDRKVELISRLYGMPTNPKVVIFLVGSNDVRNFVEYLDMAICDGFSADRVTSARKIGGIINSEMRFFIERFMQFFFGVRERLERTDGTAFIVVGLFNMMKGEKYANPSCPAGDGFENPGYNELFPRYNERIKEAVRNFAAYVEPPHMEEYDFSNISEGVHLRRGYEKLWTSILSAPLLPADRLHNGHAKEQLKHLKLFCEKHNVRNPYTRHTSVRPVQRFFKPPAGQENLLSRRPIKFVAASNE